MTTTPTLRDRVAGVLTSAGWTQTDLARQAGVSKQRIQQILDGTASPSLALAIRLEDLTGIPARQWGEGQKPAA